ncbi:putative PLAC8 motif-containing protein [Lupinus albus]|uniref:Putative PLAC8 motif-containing protein n=1 Tax=Lupinus albus TaxID=3870 RepID=A0A6A4NG39_LUPAL|nr:putative PLAC8 motif-containing protein [Lupinus albus]
MVSVDNRIGNLEDEIEECNNGSKVNEFASVDISTSRKTFMSCENPERKFQGTSNSLPNRINLIKFDSPSANFMRIATEKDKISQSVPSRSPQPHCLKESFSGMFGEKLDWRTVKKMGMEWFRNPINIALFAWILCVAVSGAILFLVMTGMLNSVLPIKSVRNTWFEVNNQILNALFTLMCLYQHPKRFHHLVLLCRWRPSDISTLRKLYCKNGTYKPHEWTHMMVVVMLLHLNCFSQYALCGLNLGYKRSDRPAVGVGICISIAIAAPAVAGLYTILCPLGKDYDCEMDEEAQVQITAAQMQEPRQKPFKMKYSFASKDQRQVIENRPKWSGGILDIWEDISLAYLSLFCTFCVFGWNMERLGFGNMYVHIATFMLFCVAPFWIFVLAAVNIDDDDVRQPLVAVGILLCFFGLLYGGFWRILMRKRFNLPAYNFCFGKPSVSDCTLWLCCCWCSLAQEARTADHYDLVQQKLCSKDPDQPSIRPLAREHFVSTKSGTSSDRPLATLEEEHSQSGKDGIMNPPIPSLIQREAP